MRPIFVVLGLIVVLLGVAWALQGAYILPASFMRGPEWIAIGTAAPASRWTSQNTHQ